MASSEIRITPAVKTVLELFLKDLSVAHWGYSIMAATGYPSGKVYQILERLDDAGWLTRHDAGPKARDTGQKRITYTMTAEAVPMIRRALAEAEQREQRGSRIRVHLPRLQPDITTGTRWGAPHMVTWLIGIAALAVAFIVITVIGGAVLMALRKPFAEEIGHQIDKFPERLFFVALRFFPVEERERRYDQWAEDYQELSDTYENRTLIRIIKCTRFSLSLVIQSHAIGRIASARVARPKRVWRLKPARRLTHIEVRALEGKRFYVRHKPGGPEKVFERNGEFFVQVNAENFKMLMNRPPIE